MTEILKFPEKNKVIFTEECIVFPNNKKKIFHSLGACYKHIINFFIYFLTSLSLLRVHKHTVIFLFVKETTTISKAARWVVLSHSQKLFQNEDRFLFSLGTNNMLLPQPCILSLFSLRKAQILFSSRCKKALLPLLKCWQQSSWVCPFFIHFMLN